MVLRVEFNDWRPSDGTGAGGLSGLGEVFTSSARSFVQSGSVFAGVQSIDEAYERRIKAVKDAVGISLVHPGLRVSLTGEASDPYGDFDKELVDLAERHPDKAALIRADLSPLAEANARRRIAEQNADDVLRRYHGAWGTGTVASFAGGMFGTFQDPVNAMANLIGPWGGARAGINGLIWMGLKQGAANAAVEAAQQPIVQYWRQRAGLNVTAADIAFQVGAAGALGFGLDAGVRGAYRGVQRARGLEARLDGDGYVDGYWTPEQALEDAARKSKNETLRKAAAGDVGAMETLAKETGAIEDLSIRGAIEDLKNADSVPTHVPGVDSGEHLSRLAQALRHADDPDANPPPLRAEAVPEARGVSIADDVPAPSGRVATIDGKPATFASIDLKRTITDAATFQFKRGGDIEGSTGRLGGVERWDPVAAGRAVIFQRRDGAHVIADAHQRRSLAMRLADQETVVEAVVLREADGWTPGDVKALAAKKNLQEGSGTVIDAAAIIRERPDIIDKSVPLGSDAMRQARSLARLSDEAFGHVVAGVVHPGHAAMIADLVPDKSRHASVLMELVEADPANAAQARLLLNEIIALPVTVEDQMTLLGVWRIERSLMKERVGVLEAALKALRTDARVLRLVNREADRLEGAGNRVAADTNAARATEAALIEDVIQGLATTHGPVSTWLTEAARAVNEGQPKRRAADAFVAKVADVLDREGLAGLSAPEPRRQLDDGGIDDVRGPSADVQIQRLEQELSDDIARATDPTRAELEAEGQQALFALARGDVPVDVAVKLAEAEARARVIIDGPEYRSASRIDPATETVRRPGYGTPEDLASRRYITPEGEIVGSRAAELYLYERAIGRVPGGVERGRRLFVVIGYPGAGKSSIVESLQAQFRAAHLVNDDAKLIIPEYDGGKGAARVHEEAGQLMGRVAAAAMKAGDSVIIEKLGTTDASIVRVADQFRSGGYSVSLVHVDVPREIAMERAARRFVSSGRAVPAGIYDTLDARGVFDRLITEEGRIDEHATISWDVAKSEWVITRADGSLVSLQIRQRPGRPVGGVRPDRGGGAGDGLSGGIAPEATAGEGSRAGKVVSDRDPSLNFISLLKPETWSHTPLADAAARDIRKAVDEVVARLPDGVKARVEDRLVFGGREIDGRYDLTDGAVYISLRSADPVRVARHEEVHVLRNLGLIDDGEWRLLLDHAAANNLGERYDIQGRYAEAYRKMFGDQADDRLLEETIAEMVADYGGGARFGSMVDQVLQVVVDFVNGLARALGLKGFRTVGDVFRAIESGEIGRRAARNVDTAVEPTRRAPLRNDLYDAGRSGHAGDVVEACRR